MIRDYSLLVFWVAFLAITLGAGSEALRTRGHDSDNFVEHRLRRLEQTEYEGSITPSTSPSAAPSMSPFGFNESSPSPSISEESSSSPSIAPSSSPSPSVSDESSSSPSIAPSSSSSPSVSEESTWSPSVAPSSSPSPSVSEESTWSPSVAPSSSPSLQEPGNSSAIISQFTIEFLFDSGIDDRYKEPFMLAAKRWSSIIIGDLPTRVRLEKGEYCGGYHLKHAQRVEDLLISVGIRDIDGYGGILGRAGPCLVDSLRIPRFGVMEFDKEDVEVMIATGTFNNVILHEMGHVLGIGSLWEYLDLVDTYYQPRLFYTGVEGNLGNEDIGRSGRAVVEDQGGAGTIGGHWKEDGPNGYDTELMTGYAERPGVPMPLSKLTVRALRDLGYYTDESQADPFDLSPPTAPPSSSSPVQEDSSALRGHRRRLGDKIALGGDIIKVKELKQVQDSVKPGRDKEVQDRRKRSKQHPRRKG